MCVSASVCFLGLLKMMGNYQAERDIPLCVQENFFSHCERIMWKRQDWKL